MWHFGIKSDEKSTIYKKNLCNYNFFIYFCTRYCSKISKTVRTKKVEFNIFYTLFYLLIFIQLWVKSLQLSWYC